MCDSVAQVRARSRFTRPEMEAMMKSAGLSRGRFSEREPFWVACGVKQ